MDHGITDLEWIAYLDGDAPVEVRDRIEGHLTGCLVCWEFYERTVSATRSLDAAGQDVRRLILVEDARLHRMMRAVFSDLQAETTISLQDKLDTLENVLAPICGAQTATQVLRSAAMNSPARTLAEVTRENWEPFLERLRAIIAAMCGDTCARLVWEQGRL
jgi:predicted anti-sigma-YlaC factor YlaD